MILASSSRTEAGIRARAAQRAAMGVPALAAPEQPRAPVALPVAGVVLKFPTRPVPMSAAVKTALHRGYALRFTPYSPWARTIISQVAAWQGFTFDEVASPRRFIPLVLARTDAIVALRYAFPFASLPWLGRQMGNLDHTTILHHLRKRGVR